ncbi:hypothetical protein Dsin_004744 [Dipteronia sinensis]|uniref:HMA domain-containing protein n=1 Tax=Dipteronia sinensis TaxID=43782 RepID=A0AAE0AVK1_9ROSI|nr:hypothetical protein Dsin_004744 [Dipteronia sinensis]
MASLTKNSLLYSENLSRPSFQVIVMTANMGCAQCRQRVTQVVSKMSGLKECTVDVPNRQVIVKGDFGFRRNLEDNSPKNKLKTRCYPLQYFFKNFRVNYFT